MSYVIQNFYDCSKKITKTPRFKFFFILNNISKFYIFLKFNTFFHFISKNNNLSISYFPLFFKYFFSKYYLKLIYNANLTLVGNYLNNLTKGYIFHIFNNIDLFLSNKTSSLSFFKVNEKFLYNFYFFSIKTLNVKVNKNFYKNIFFFFMIMSPFMWYQHTSSFKFYLNFIFINYSLKSFRFYNGYFLKVYSF